MTLHTDQALFRELITATSTKLGIAEVYIEKDYWVSVILKRVSELEDSLKSKVVFKGGTSLSKAHKLIERFSEDVDLAVIAEGLSDGQTKTLLKTIEKALLTKDLIELSKEEHPMVSKGSKFRKTVHRYPRDTKGAFGDAQEVIILELNSFTNPTPYALKMINTYIYDFLIESDAQDVIEEHQLQPFEINVLELKRTLCEKISAIAAASYEGTNTLQAKIRHFYDIHHLLELPEIQTFFISDTFYEMLETVRSNDIKMSKPDANIEVQTIEHSPIFTDAKTQLSAVRNYYETTFATLVHGTLPPFEKVQASVIKVAERLKERDVYDRKDSI